jgi:acetyl esterase/lipase
MTGLFFLFSLWFGWLAYNIFHPIYNNSKGALLSFLAGWLTAELAIHHILWQVVLVSLFVLGGAVSGFLGALGFLICVSAWIALGYHYLLSDKAETEVSEALYDGLGEDYLSKIHDEFSSRFPVAPDFDRIKWPFTGNHPKVEVLKNIPFGVNDQYLDIYRPRQKVENAPVLFQIHGGGWTEKMGSKNEQALPLMNHMALRNWICVSADYRLSPTATAPDHIVDCKQALVWIREEIASYGGNPDFVVVTGGSAGGHLAALMALSANDPTFQPGFEGEDTTVQGAVPFYGAYDFTNANGYQKNDALIDLIEASVMKLPKQENIEAFRQSSPLFRVTESAPPFLIIHGDKDTLLPVEEARFFADQLRDVARNPVVYAEISGGQHAFDMFESVRSEHVKHGVERFLGYIYSRYLDAPAQVKEDPW